MKIYVFVDKSVMGRDELAETVEKGIENKFERFSGYLTSLHVHLSDENEGKTGGNDKKCTIEARPANGKPVAATTISDKMGTSINRTCAKIVRKLNRIQEKNQGGVKRQDIRDLNAQ